MQSVPPACRSSAPIQSCSSHCVPPGVWASTITCRHAPAAARRTHAGSTQRSSRSSLARPPAALAAAQRPVDAVCFDLDALVQGTEVLSTAWALAACQELGWTIDGSTGLYARHMQQLLPVLEQPRDAALLLRLLHDEGIVGAHSTGGREGPVVGRPVRHSGSRPLLLNEVLEHWQDEIRPTCLLRWARQQVAATTAAAAGDSGGSGSSSGGGGSSSGIASPHVDLEQQVQEAYQQAQQLVEWRVLDARRQQHGGCSPRSSDQPHQPAAAACSKPARSSSTSTATAGTTGSSSSSSDGGRSSGSRRAVATLSPEQCAPIRTAAAAPTGAAVHADPAQRLSAATAVVQSFASVVPCVTSCQQQVWVASTYPPEVTEAVLAAAGLLQPAGSRAAAPPVAVLHGASVQDCMQQFAALQQQLAQQQQQQQQQQQLAWQQRPSRGQVAAGGGSVPCRQVLVVLSSPTKATTSLVHSHLQQQGVAGQPGPAPAAAAPTAADAGGQQQLLQGAPWQLHMKMAVGDWVCRAPGLRARALAQQAAAAGAAGQLQPGGSRGGEGGGGAAAGCTSLGLLSECGLADLLGVAECDAVMDGIAWR